MRDVILLFCFVLTPACGPAPVIYEPGDGTPPAGGAYTFERAIKDCRGCHAGAPFIADEAAFKGSPAVLNQVETDKMPKGNPYDAKTKAAFTTFYNKK